MAQASSVALLFINPAHTAGQDLASDIVVADDLLEPLCHAVNDDADLWYSLDDAWDEDDDDHTPNRSVGAVWAWRKPRLRKA